MIEDDEQEPGNHDAEIKLVIRGTSERVWLVIRRTSEQVWEAAPISELGSPSFATLMQTIRQVFPDVAIAPGMVLGATDSRRMIPTSGYLGMLSTIIGAGPGYRLRD